MLQIQLHSNAFQAYDLLVEHAQKRQSAWSGKVGAEAIFIGYLRDFRDDTRVQSMWIEHYSPMTERQLERIAAPLIEQYTLQDLFIVHRVGQIHLNEAIVLISARAAHRKNAFCATQDMLENLKSQAPFWKKEQTDSGAHWVDKNSANVLQNR